MAIYAGCSFNYFEVILANFYNNQDNAINFFKEHCVLPQSVDCPKCKRACSYHEDQHLWSSTNLTKIAKSKKRKYFNYSIYPRLRVLSLKKVVFLCGRFYCLLIIKCLGLSSLEVFCGLALFLQQSLL